MVPFIKVTDYSITGPTIDHLVPIIKLTDNSITGPTIDHLVPIIKLTDYSITGRTRNHLVPIIKLTDYSITGLTRNHLVPIIKSTDYSITGPITIDPYLDARHGKLGFSKRSPRLRHEVDRVAQHCISYYIVMPITSQHIRFKRESTKIRLILDTPKRSILSQTIFFFLIFFFFFFFFFCHAVD